jgi:hypothetical protein
MWIKQVAKSFERYWLLIFIGMDDGTKERLLF